jgi:thiamine biosynthesis lipoprotein
VGIRAAMLEAGGDIVAGDAPPGAEGWRIETTSEVVLPVGTQNDLRGRFRVISNTALATSGPSAQFVEIDGVRYSHVVDPRTGWALTSGVTAHVIASDAASRASSD